MIKENTLIISNKIEEPGIPISEAKGALSNILKFKDLLAELTKIRITFFVSVTTFVGFILNNGTLNFDLILTTIGVLILAGGASALNEYQERNIDAKMERTSLRPIPSGMISPQNALIISIALIMFGSILLAQQSISVSILGLFTLAWYNGIYTPLKSVSSLAIIPGALVGALPPIIGWAASGGYIFDAKILSFASFMFIWQIPHFWLLLLLYDEQYKKAGFPTLSNLFSFNQIIKITFVWITILIASSSLFYFSSLSVSLVSNIVLAASGVFTLYLSAKILTVRKKEVFKKSFLLINAYVLLTLIVISVESFI